MHKQEELADSAATSSSAAIFKVCLSRNTSLPTPAPFFTDVPVITSLSSGLNMQSVLQSTQVQQHKRSDMCSENEMNKLQTVILSTAEDTSWQKPSE